MKIENVRKNYVGHLMAFVCVAVWGTTFVVTKVMLNDFLAIEIAMFRFILAFAFLNIIKPKRLKVGDIQKEKYFIAAGLMGVTLYFLLENIALSYTTAANVGVIISTVPFFTGIVTMIFFKGKKLTKQFVLGFIIAMIGILAISYNNVSELSLNPLGDILTILAAITWAFYSNYIKKIGEFGYPMLLCTRRIFFYGILFMIPATFAFPFQWNLERFLNPIYLGNIFYLGFGASAICFVVWNIAIKKIGTVKSSIYLYLSPIITMMASAIVLQEPMTVVTFIGAALTTVGLIISSKS